MQNKSMKWKKFISVAMISGLIVGNGAMTASATNDSTKVNPEKDLRAINVLSTEKANMVKQMQKNMKDAEDIKKEAIEPTKDVRIIVEISGKSGVEIAADKGVQYKELSSTEKTKIETDLIKAQTNVKTSISAKGIELDTQIDYTTTFNGFSGIVQFSEIEKIKNLPNVTNVYIANEYEKPEIMPDMTTSHDFIQSRQTWADSKYKGEGTVIAVIDSGIDPDHKDFNLTDGTKADLTKGNIADLIKSKGLKGEFYNEKVPYAYNYYDKNAEISDSSPGASMHGMHVAGTVGANGDEANGGIKGVAPESQLLGMKVFSNDVNFPSTFSDIYLAAIDDAVKLGADVLNMSLGSTSSFYDEDSAENKAITNAVANGIVASVSAGNSGTISYGAGKPHYDSPDYGLVGSPGLNADTIQVAATGNLVNNYTHEVDFGDFKVEGFGVDDWTSLKKENSDDLEVVSLKKLSGKSNALGAPSDYDGIDVKGKVVVVQRGTFSFIDKTNNAAAAGAAGIIVYNSDSPVFYKDQGGWDIPFMKISKAQGEALEAELAGGEIGGEVTKTNEIKGPEVGRATDFTSWGVTPDLEFKPELSAPGGNIYSTLEKDKYGVMSGTSMAAPHVAGGAALVQQYLKADDKFKNYSVEDRTRVAKKLLLNTADVTTGLDGDTISPRRQGAGMMQLHSAVTTPVVVTEKTTKEAKVNMKDFTENSFTFTLNAENLSTKDATYRVDTSVLVDMFEEAGGVTYNQLKSGNLEGAKVTAPSKVTVPANGTKDIEVTIDISNSKVPGLDANGKAMTKAIEQDVFIEGFVKLVAEDTAIPDLVVPYISFYGEWDRPEVIDSFGPAEADEKKLFQALYDGRGFTDATDHNSAFIKPVKVGEEYVYAVSPNNDNLRDGILGIPSLLRNAKVFETNILDASGKKLTTVSVENDVRKSYYNGGRGAFYSYKASRTWDGKAKGQTVKDGVYQYEFKTKVDYEDAEWQSKKLPVYIDTVAPTAGIVLNDETVQFNFEDEGVGASTYAVYINEKRLPETGFFEAKNNTLKLADYNLTAADVKTVEVAVYDHAYNLGYAANSIGDVEKPVIYVDDAGPEALGLYKDKTVPVKGYITDDFLDTLTVNGVKVPVTKSTRGYEFDTTTTVAGEGRQEVKIKATDVNGNFSEIIRPIYVDVTSPTVAVDAPKVVNNDMEEATFNIIVKDNFNLMNLTLDGDVLFSQDSFDETKFTTPTNETVKATVALKSGMNTFTVVAEDGAGNKVTKEVKIERAESELRAERISGATRYDTAVELSKEGWESSDTVVLARGDNYADALAGVPLAKKNDAPLLLSKTSSLPSSTYDEIKRLGAKKVYVLGGTAAISDKVVKQLKADSIEVVRLSGKDRYETAAKIAGEFGTADSAIVVSGLNFPDALSVASYAGSNSMPILLTRDNSLPEATQAALVKLKTNRSLVIGGKVAVSEAVAKALPNAYRISGASRYETSLEVAKYFGNPTDTVYVATGSSYADALAGGALAAKKGTGVYLVGKNVPAELGEHLQKNEVDFAKVIGGTVAVSDQVLKELDAYLKNK